MIAGPNGAGKSTLYETRIRPFTTAPFINADIIQRDELKDSSMNASYEAAKIAESRRQDCLKNGKDFVSESTFSHPSKLDLVRDAKAAGFRIAMYHVNVRSPELSIDRVAQRFGKGGHNVPEDKIRERFARNPALIRTAGLIADAAFIYDNSILGKPPEMVVELRKGNAVYVAERVPTWARELYSKELEPFSQARLNPAADSFSDAKKIAIKIGGENAEVRLPSSEKGIFHEGKIVGETALHWLQETQKDVYIAHFKSGITGDIKLQNTYKIAATNHGKTPANLIQPLTSIAQTTQPIGSKMNAPEYTTALNKLGGKDVGSIDLPRQNNTYNGKILQLSETHIVQQVSKNKAIAHDASKLANGKELLRVASAELKNTVFDFKYNEKTGVAEPSLAQPIKKSIASPTTAPRTAPSPTIKR